MHTLPPNPILGFRQLAELLGTTAGALYVAQNRGKLDIQPIGFIGRVAVFDRQQALEYAERRKKAKSNNQFSPK